MAEIAASIVGISSFGINLTLTLYEFGSTTKAAKEQTDHIAKHVTLYSNVLEILAERLEADEPIISEAALDLVDELYDQSRELFRTIRTLLPVATGKQGLSLKQKLMWPFKRKKIDLLVAELEYLKTTVQLLVTVIFTEKKISAHFRGKRRTKAPRSDAHRQSVAVECLKAQTAIVGQLNASDALQDLKADTPAEQSQSAPDEAQSTAGLLPVQSESSSQSPSLWRFSALHDSERDNGFVRHEIVTADHQDILSSTCQGLRSIEDRADRQAHVLQNSEGILCELIRQWTTISYDSGLQRDSPAQMVNIGFSDARQGRIEFPVPLLLTNSGESGEEVHLQATVDHSSSTTPPKGDPRLQPTVEDCDDDSGSELHHPKRAPRHHIIDSCSESDTSDREVLPAKPRPRAAKPVRKPAERTGAPDLERLFAGRSPRSQQRHEALLRHLPSGATDLLVAHETFGYPRQPDIWSIPDTDFSIRAYNGRHEVFYPAGSFVTIGQSEEWELADGSSIKVWSDGKEEWSRSDGKVFVVQNSEGYSDDHTRGHHCWVDIWGDLAGAESDAARSHFEDRFGAIPLVSVDEQHGNPGQEAKAQQPASHLPFGKASRPELDIASSPYLSAVHGLSEAYRPEEMQQKRRGKRLYRIGALTDGKSSRRVRSTNCSF